VRLRELPTTACTSLRSLPPRGGRVCICIRANVVGQSCRDFSGRSGVGCVHGRLRSPLARCSSCPARYCRHCRSKRGKRASSPGGFGLARGGGLLAV
jgi:hypothetical protein